MLDPLPKVSIVLPTYNRAALIGETIRSVIGQKYTNWELLIMDDGSDDDTQSVVSEIHDERISFHKSGRIAINGRVKNIGIRRSKGDLIGFIDSDDLWAETKLEKQVAALQQFPGAAFSLTGGYNFTGRGRPVDFFYSRMDGMFYGDIVVPFFQSEISATTPSLLFRRSCLETVKGFDETLPFSDIEFILALGNNFKAVVLYEPLVFRRLHEANDSRANWIPGYQQGLRLIHHYRKHLPPAVFRNALFKLHTNFGEDCLQRGSGRKASAEFFRAWRAKPGSFVPLRKIGKTIFRWMLNSPAEQDRVNIRAKPWTKNRPPQRVLAIRLQAIGDVVITLPYLQNLRRSLPSSTKLDFLTRAECADIPSSLVLFDQVISLGGGRNFSNQLLYAIALLPRLLLRRYDMVLDLQSNEVSLLMRKILRPAAWTEFDKYSPRAAGERTRLTIEAAGLTDNKIASGFRFKNEANVVQILKRHGWDEQSEIVLLNPAGAFPTRNWPIENFACFAQLWLNSWPNTQFLVLGTQQVQPRAGELLRNLGERLISIVGDTTPSVAFAIMQKVTFVLSEDSGLMHMAWVSDIPTLVLFGSTRSDWSRPLGAHSVFFDSTDLPCGNCMQEVCAYGDNHCITRYTPQFVFEKAAAMLGRVS